MPDSKIAGVIGWPVAHSLSPKLHNYWLKHYGIDGEYRRLAVEPKDLETVIKALPQMGWQGCNLTIPHKEAVIKWLDTVDKLAKEIDAVNTIITKDGKLHGTNTDTYGFTENTRSSLPEKRKKAVILGAGGAAKSVCKALLGFGFAEIVILNRTRGKAVALAVQSKNKLTVASWDERAEFLENADLLVNATSLGMTGNEPLDLDLAALPGSALVTDIVYTPLLTPLLHQAAARGNPIVDGLGMLLHQAVPAFEAWFGVRPEVTKELREYILT